MTKPFFYRTSILLLSAIVTACGGGGGSGDGGDISYPPLTGTFYDSEVSGLRYRAEKYSGTTNSLGQFTYYPGDEIEFLIGDKVIGITKGRQILTPVDVVNDWYSKVADDYNIEGRNNTSVENNTDEETDGEVYTLTNTQKDQAVINLVRLLMTLDSDGNPDNGIHIAENVHQFFTDNVTVIPNFAKPFNPPPPGTLLDDEYEVPFEESEAIKAIEQGLLQATVQASSTDADECPNKGNSPWVCAEQARTHFAETLKEVRGSNDEDGDGVPDVIDQAPTNADLFSDMDGDRIQDSEDRFPYDSSESIDSDGDGYGDNNDDKFPYDPSDHEDSDSDGYGDNAEIAWWTANDPNVENPHLDPNSTIDSDGDGHDDQNDAFPNNPREWRDRDEDGVCTEEQIQSIKDGEEVLYNCALACSTEQTLANNTAIANEENPIHNCEDKAYRLPKDLSDDSDWLFGDGYGDNSDNFINDASEWLDTDGDSVGDNSDPYINDPDNDQDGIDQEADAFPLDPSEFLDSDGDGVGDFSDAFPYDSEGKVDSDNDGLPDYFETLYTDSNTAMSPNTDSDNDGFSNLIEYQYKSDPTSNLEKPKVPSEFVHNTNRWTDYLPIDSSSGNFNLFTSVDLNDYVNAAYDFNLGGSLNVVSHDSEGRIIFSNGGNAATIPTLKILEYNDLDWTSNIIYNFDYDPIESIFVTATSEYLYTFANRLDGDNPGVVRQLINDGLNDETTTFYYDDSDPVEFSYDLIFTGSDFIFHDRQKNTIHEANDGDNFFPEQINYDLYRVNSGVAPTINAVTSTSNMDIIAHSQRVDGSDQLDVYVEFFANDGKQKYTGNPENPVTPIQFSSTSQDISTSWCGFSKPFGNFIVLMCEVDGSDSNTEVLLINLQSLSTVWHTTFDSFVDAKKALIDFDYVLNTEEHNINGLVYLLGSGALYALDFQTGELKATFDFENISNGEYEHYFITGIIASSHHIFLSDYYGSLIIDKYDLFDAQSFNYNPGYGSRQAFTPEGNIVYLSYDVTNANEDYRASQYFHFLNLNGDIDNDGIPDIDEDSLGFDKENPSDALLDYDSDTVSNLEEYLTGRDPLIAEDTDTDGLPDYWEEQYNLDPNDGTGRNGPDGDPDLDGENNLTEFQNGTNPIVALDTDGDGMPDYWENLYGLNPNNSDDAALDDDSDGYTNIEEYQNGTLPSGDGSFNDIDGDGMPDAWEDENFLDKSDPSDATKDPDGDGKTNFEEYQDNTNPRLPEDTDGDGMPDYWEIKFGLDPTTFGPLVDGDGNDIDTDKDGVSDWQEYQDGTIPNDEDQNGLPDNWEATNNATDPDADADNDELTNLQEYENGTNPNLADTDSDTMPDKWEIENELDPTDASDKNEDPDGDGLFNFEEYEEGTDPNVEDNPNPPSVS